MLLNHEFYNLQDEKGDTYLHLAIRERLSPELINLLIQLGSNPWVRNKAGYTVFHEAVKIANFEAFREMINIANKDGNTLLHFASIKGNLNQINCLLSWGANPYLENKLSKSPLCYEKRRLQKGGKPSELSWFLEELENDSKREKSCRCERTEVSVSLANIGIEGTSKI
ncbi:MAG: ankyrin repeat domain-containing protein [Wolbachia endosymbiont of Tyrophagus putrescentiae]|nr:ankyrin repeat domain-containing protein [Wolbachia endosymbiont of Tyrophagus putrescentiae]